MACLCIDVLYYVYICNVLSFNVKTHQNAFDGWALPGLAGELTVINRVNPLHGWIKENSKNERDGTRRNEWEGKGVEKKTDEGQWGRSVTPPRYLQTAIYIEVSGSGFWVRVDSFPLPVAYFDLMIPISTGIHIWFSALICTWKMPSSNVLLLNNVYSNHFRVEFRRWIHCSLNSGGLVE